MKTLKMYYKFVVLLITTISFVACTGSDVTDDTPTGTGFLTIKSIGVDVKITSSLTARIPDPIPAPSSTETDNWIVEILDSNDNVVAPHTYTVATVPASISLAPGNYTVRVRSGDAGGAIGKGVANAYFEGRAPVTITDGSNETVTVTAKVASRRVSIDYDTLIANGDFTSYTTTVTNTDDNTFLEFTEMDSGDDLTSFFPLTANLLVEVELADASNTTYTLTPLAFAAITDFDVTTDTAPHDIINIDYELNPMGSIGPITIGSVDVSTNDTTHVISTILVPEPIIFFDGGMTTETNSIFHDGAAFPFTNPLPGDAVNPSTDVIHTDKTKMWAQTELFPTTNYTIQNGDKFYISFYNPDGASNWQLQLKFVGDTDPTIIDTPVHNAASSTEWFQESLDLSAHTGKEFEQIVIYAAAEQSDVSEVFYDDISIGQ